MPRILPDITFDGRSMPRKAWAAEIGLSYTGLTRRLESGLPMEKVLVKGRINAVGGLSPRHRETLILMARGEPTKSIAGILGIAKSTASKHRQGVLDYFQTSDTASVVVKALRSGHLKLEEI